MILEIFRFIFFFFFVFFPPRILNVIVRHSKDNFYRIISYIRFLILIFFLLYWTWQKCESPLLDYPLISLKRRGKFRKSLSRLTLIQEHLDGGWWNLTRFLCKCTEDLHQPRSSLNELLEPVSFGSREFDILIRHLKKKNQNDFYRPGILVAIIKQTTYLIFPYLLLRYEISVVQVKYSKMINYKLSIRQYVRSLYSLSSRNHLFEKKKMKNRKHVKYIIRYSDLFFFHLSRENFPTLEFLSFFFFSYFVISLEKNFFITDHVKTWIFHTLKFPCISYHYETTYWNFKSLSKWYSIDKKGKNK